MLPEGGTFLAHDTIVAQATPPGRSGVGIVRASGPEIARMIPAMLHRQLTPREATYCPFFDKDDHLIDRGIAIYFVQPNSFTGEDLLELHCHGNQLIVDLLVERFLRIGARMARPGEFSERAFLNQKIDLAQAEAIADLINASSQQAVIHAARSLAGAFGTVIQPLVASLVELRAQVEGSLDFPDEELEVASMTRLSQSLAEITTRVQLLRATASENLVVQEGIQIAIVGHTNAGKSTLFNGLVGAEAAIVTEIPGTTRDVLRERIAVRGGIVTICDTAGLRSVNDPVESEGIRRAKAELQRADHIFLVLDCTQDNREFLQEIAGSLSDHQAVTAIYNKVDLLGAQPRPTAPWQDVVTLYLSAKTGQGWAALQDRMQQLFRTGNLEDGFSTRRRHLESLHLAEQALRLAAEVVRPATLELCAEHLQQAQHCLAVITGEVTNEDILTKIFSEFCIGK